MASMLDHTHEHVQQEYANGDRVMGYVCSSPSAMRRFVAKCEQLPSPSPAALPLELYGCAGNPRT